MNSETAQDEKIYSEKALFTRSHVWLLIFLHSLITLPLAYFLNIWVDEASTLSTTQNGFWSAIQNALTAETQAPLYFGILAIWRELNDSVFFARLLSIIFSCVAIKVFSDVLKRFLPKNRANVLILAIFAVHPFLVWTSLEIRLYSLVVLLSTLLLRTLFDGFVSEKKSIVAQNLYVLLAIVALYTNYYLGFLLVANFCFLLGLREWRAARNYFIQMIFVGVTIIPLLLEIRRQLGVNADYVRAEPSIIDGFKVAWTHIIEFTLPAVDTPFWTFRTWFTRICLLGIFYLAWKNRGKFFTTQNISLGLMIAVISVFLVVAFYLLGISYVATRHAAVLFAPLILFLGAIFSSIFQRRCWIIWLSFTVLFFGGTYFTKYENLAKRGDWARVATFIQTNEKPEQPIVVFSSFDVLAFQYSYRGINAISTKSAPVEWKDEALRGTPDSRRSEIEFIISQIPANSDKIWLLTNELCDGEVTKNACQPLEEFVEKNYEVEINQQFYQERLRLLRKR